MVDRIAILIVEDQILVAKDLESRLRAMGYSVIGHAKDGETALKMAKDRSPDIVLMDIDIAGEVNGIETAKAMNRTLTLPIVYLTKFEDEPTFNEARRTSPCDFITKPFNDVRLSRAIEMAVERFRKLREKAENAKPVIYLRVDGKSRKLLVEQILWIRAAGTYCYLKTPYEELMFSKSLAKLVEEIDGQMEGSSPLLRIHRSTVVNIENVDGLYAKDVSIHGTRKRIAKSRRKEVGQTLGLLDFK